MVPKSSTLDDPERPWTTYTHSVAEKMRLLEPTAQIWIKIDPCHQRQTCRPITLVSGNIRCMRKFAGGSSWRGPQMRVGLSSTTAIFGDLRNYFFGNFRYKASSIIWQYSTPCPPVIDCKMNDLELPWVQYSRIRVSCNFKNYASHCLSTWRHSVKKTKFQSKVCMNVKVAGLGSL